MLSPSSVNLVIYDEYMRKDERIERESSISRSGSDKPNPIPLPKSGQQMLPDQIQYSLHVLYFGGNGNNRLLFGQNDYKLPMRAPRRITVPAQIEMATVSLLFIDSLFPFG